MEGLHSSEMNFLVSGSDEVWEGGLWREEAECPSCQGKHLGVLAEANY